MWVDYQKNHGNLGCNARGCSSIFRFTSAVPCGNKKPGFRSRLLWLVCLRMAGSPVGLGMGVLSDLKSWFVSRC
jgi:hypothetical protein